MVTMGARGLAQLVEATNRKVSGSIPDGVIGIFHWHNPSGSTVALGATPPLTEISTSNISWGGWWPVCRADNLTTFMCRLSWNLGSSTSWNYQGLSRPVQGLFCRTFTGYIVSLHDFISVYVMIIFFYFYKLCHFKKCYFLAQIESRFLFYK
jgi:hypothetical protein